MQILGEILPESPVRAVGINYGEHWKVDRPERRLMLGRKLAPLEPWGAWGKTFKDHGEETAGMNVLQMKQPLPGGAGHRLVTVEPSLSVVGGESRGVHLAVNYHRQLATAEGGARAAVEIIREEFDEATTFAKRLIEEFRAFADQLELS